MKWIMRNLGEIAVEDRKIIDPESAESAKLPYWGLDQIESQTGRILAIDSSSSEGRSNTFSFDDRHVLYGKLRPYLNKVAVPEYAGRCSTEIIPLLPQGVDREFLAFLLRTDQVVKAAMAEKTGSRMPRTNMDNLFQIEVKIAETIADQRRIAARVKAQLAEVETARNAAEAQLEGINLLPQKILAAAFTMNNKEGII